MASAVRAPTLEMDTSTSKVWRSSKLPKPNSSRASSRTARLVYRATLLRPAGQGRQRMGGQGHFIAHAPFCDDEAGIAPGFGQAAFKIGDHTTLGLRSHSTAKAARPQSRLTSKFCEGQSWHSGEKRGFRQNPRRVASRCLYALLGYRRGPVQGRPVGSVFVAAAAFASAAQFQSEIALRSAAAMRACEPH